MKKRKLAVRSMDTSIEELATRTDPRTVAIRAADCDERVLPSFEERYPGDSRPRVAIEAVRAWVQTGAGTMADIRKVALSVHAAAREAGEGTAACSAARAAGQALATAHVPRHALAAAQYAATAVRDATDSSDTDPATVTERIWQYHHLRELGPC